MSYLVFAADDYYPEGGWGDYRGTAESIEEAKQIAESLATARARQNREPLEWAQIVDVRRQAIVLQGETDGLRSLERRLQNVKCGGNWYNWEPFLEIKQP